MKISFIISFICLFQLTATVYSQNGLFTIETKTKNTTMRELFHEIEQQSSFRFFYNDVLIDIDQKVSIDVSEKRIDELMDIVLANSGITYRILDNQLIVVSPVALLQQPVITGVVTDTNGDPLPGVSIMIKGTTMGTATDVNGTFTLQAPNENTTLTFSFIGFVTQEIQVGNRRTINVTLVDDTRQLEEVVVIGYGTQSREMITTSISKLDTKVLENVPYTNAASALQGTMSGLRVQSTDGQPGVAPRIIVRGGTSINNPNGAQPMYVIDGIIRTDMNHINSSDIESIQVLKDAASTSIYGARASNGVVIVTTKSGKAGKTSVNYDFSVSTANSVRFYDLVSARDYLYFGRLGMAATGEYYPSFLPNLTLSTMVGIGNDLTNNTAYTQQYLTPANQHKLQEGWESMPDPLDPSQTIIFQGTDWQRICYRNAITQNHSLSVSGGTDRATFYIGLGYLDAEGVAMGTDYTRYSLNTGGNLKVKDNLQFSGKVMYSNSGSHSIPNYTWMLRNCLFTVPTTKYKYEDGKLATSEYGYSNPEQYISAYKNKNTTQNLSMMVDANWEILSGLSFTPQLSVFQSSYDGRTFQMAFENGPGSVDETRNATASFNKNLVIQFDAVMTYIKNIQQHNFEAKAGYSYYGVSYAGFNAAGRGASSDFIPTLNASATPVSVGGTETHQTLIGYFGRVNYNFDQKYLLSLNMRYDGASNLGDQNKWGFFPGVSVGWNMHREDFWQPVDTYVSRFKVRGSYGVNGNISGLGPYQAQGQYSVSNGSDMGLISGSSLTYDGNSAVQNTELPNQNLQWEQSKTFDVGFDMGFLDNRIMVIFDWYRRRTDNLLATLTLPHSTGFTGITTNLGSLENKGIELELTAQIMPAARKFQWDVAFNASKVKNTILKLPYNGIENNRIGGIYTWDPSRNDYAWLGGLQEGGAIGDIYCFKQIGIYATDEEAARGLPDTQSTFARTGGDAKWFDADGDGSITDRDRIYAGNIYPTWTGGFSNYLSYMGFGLSFRFDYMLGHTINNAPAVRLLAMTSGNNTFSKDITKTWQNQGDITDLPRYYYGDVKNNMGRGSTRFMEKGDFLMLREASLSYQIPQKITQKIRINNLRFHVTGNNLYYFTKFTGLNPEEGGEDGGRYALPRTIIFGLNLTF